MKTRPDTILLAVFLGFACGSAQTTGGDRNVNTGWLRDAGYGVFVHFLPGDRQGLTQVNRFDVEALAEQLDSIGAGYLVLTLGQNSGFMNSPNATYERITGYDPGERCSTRDLPLDLYRALNPKGIKLMLYLPCQVPNGDARAQQAFGLPQGPKDQPIDTTFAGKWAEVIQDWSVRYGDRIAGWWFDGGYEWIGFNEQTATIYADAVKKGNPNAIVTFNPGVRLIRWTQAEDYTAGELNEPFDVVPTDRWVNGSQWHALTYLGDNWSRRNTRFTEAQWIEWASSVVAKQGVLTLDLGPNLDASSGPIGSLAEPQLKLVRAIGNALRKQAGGASPGRTRRGALHALLRSLGLGGHSPSSRLGRHQCRRGNQQERHLVLPSLRG